MAISDGIINDTYEEGNVSCITNRDKIANQVTMVDDVSIKFTESEYRNTINVAVDPALPGVSTLELKKLPIHLEYAFLGEDP